MILRASLSMLQKEKLLPNFGIEYVGRQKNPFPYQELNLGHPIYSVLTILTELSWLHMKRL
jgi:hypothetical protein